MGRKTLRSLRLVSLLLLWSAPVAAAQESSTDTSPHKTGFVTANGIRQHYLDWGGKSDVVLLFAGFGNDAHVFDSFAPRFTDRASASSR